MGIFLKGKNWYIDYYVKGQRKRKKIGTSKKLALQVLQDVQLKLAKGEYVFSDTNGRPFGDIKKGYAAAIGRAGIKDFRFHDLRHTFGSHLVMQGVNLRTVQQILGYKDIKMTMRYAHLSPEFVQKAVEKLDKLWTLYGHQGDLAKSKSHVSS